MAENRPPRISVPQPYQKAGPLVVDTHIPQFAHPDDPLPSVGRRVRVDEDKVTLIAPSGHAHAIDLRHFYGMRLSRDGCVEILDRNEKVLGSYLMPKTQEVDSEGTLLWTSYHSLWVMHNLHLAIRERAYALRPQVAAKPGESPFAPYLDHPVAKRVPGSGSGLLPFDRLNGIAVLEASPSTDALARFFATRPNLDPVELMPGRKYVYFRNFLAQQHLGSRGVYEFFTVLGVIAFVGACAWLFWGGPSTEAFVAVIASLGLLVAGAREWGTSKRLADCMNDVLALDEKHLVVQRGGRTMRFPLDGKREVSLAPNRSMLGGRADCYGGYCVDRRYLIEADEADVVLRTRR